MTWNLRLATHLFAKNNKQMNKTKLLRTLFLLTVLLLCGTKLHAQQPYAVLSEGNTTLTFYYDDSKESRNGMDVGPFTYNKGVNSGWYEQSKSIINVVFDDSFADCTSVTSTAYWFYECNNLTTITGIANLHTDKVTSMRHMFYNCSSLTNLDVTNFNTQNVTDMSYMFSDCKSLTSLDVTNFETQNVTDMSYMFCNCSSLTSFDVTNFNTRNVTDMRNMFYSCSSLTSLDVTKFKTQNVTNMKGMFYECSSLTSLDLTKFNTQNVINMSNMFNKCTSLTSLDLRYFDTQNVIYMSYMFNSCSSLTSIYVGKTWNMEHVTNADKMFDGCTHLKGGAGTTYDASHTDSSYAHVDGGTENPGYLTYMESEDAREPYAVLSDDNTTLTFYYDDSKESRNGVEIGPFTYNNGVNSGWYAQRESITTVVFDDSFADCSSVSSTAYWFRECNNLTTIVNIDNLYTYNVTDMSYMFSHCYKLKNLDLRNFNTQKVSNMSFMFFGCSGLTTLDVTKFNTQNVTNMSFMFYHCVSLTSLDVTNFNTQNVTKMYSMFSDCQSLTNLDVKNFNTQKVTDMSGMFSNCQNLTSLDVIKFNTQNVTTMSGMFSNCNSLTSLDVTKFNTQNVTNMSDMFSGCNSLTSLDVSHFNTQKVTDMYYIFSDCSSLTSLDVTNFDTRKVTNMQNMFNNCSSLTSLDVTNFNTQKVTSMRNMFYNCSSLTSIDVTNFNTQNVNSMDLMFNNCSSLTNIDLTNFNTQNIIGMKKMFSGCNNLKLVTIGENMSIIKSTAFKDCPKLTDFYCLAVTVPNADSNAFDNNYIKANTTLHVPAESISDYQATVPWSNFKNMVTLREIQTDLVDGEVYENEFVVNNVDVSYTRTFSNTNWQALYVPFAMSYDDWKDDFDVAEINNFHEYDDNKDGTVDRTVLEILYVESGSTLPNTPYMIRAKQTGEKTISLKNATLLPAEENSIDCSSVKTKYTFTGTYPGVSGDEMYANGYYALAGGNLKRPSSASVSLGTFRWYLKAESRTGNDADPARTIPVRVFGDEEDAGTTGIANGAAVNGPVEYYNLEGVKVSPSEAKGIVIVRQADGSMRKVIKK